MLRRTKLLSCLLIGACSLPIAMSAVQARGVNGRIGYIDQFRETISRIVQADNSMYTQMQIIARKLDAYYARNGHLPYAGTQQEKFKANIDKVLAENPYSPKTTELYYNMKVEEDGKIKMFFLNDSFLSLDKARDYRREAPRGWAADPGTIMVMVNGEGTYAIWAASADRLPMRDYEKNNRTRIIVHDLREEFARQQASNQAPAL